MNNQFQQFIDVVSEAYPINTKDYPVTEKLNPEEKLNFSMTHIGKHISKSLGKIMSELENGDHGGVVDMEKIEKATIRLMISVLKLCDEQKITGEKLADQIPKNI